jgi:hypothetical protein
LVDSNKLRELRLKQEMLERLLPRLCSERNQERMRFEISLVAAQIKLLLSVSNDSPPLAKPRTAA